MPIIIPAEDTLSSNTPRELMVGPIQGDSFDRLLNQARQGQDLALLAPSDALGASAQSHAADMRKRGYFAHQSPEGMRAAQRAARFGVPACGVGENIAMGQKSAAEVMAGWMTSSGHRTNIRVMPKSW